MTATSPLTNIFKNQIIPWTQRWGIEKLILAQPSYQEILTNDFFLPPDVTFSYKPLQSRREPVKGRRDMDNTSSVDARWAKDRLHSTRAPKLYYVLSGHVALQLADYVVHCKPGHGICIPAGIPHSDGSHLFIDETIPGADSCDLLMLRPFRGGAHCWISHTQDGKHWSYNSTDESLIIQHWQISTYFQGLFEELQKTDAHSKSICNGILQALMHQLAREIGHGLPGLISTEAKSPERADEQDPIKLSQEYIRNHLPDPLHIDDVAKAVFMSRRRFTEQFRRQTGKSFVEYVNECRLQEACTLLKNTDWSNDLISRFIGIKPGRLRSLFLQHYRMTPGAYRQNELNRSQNPQNGPNETPNA